MTFLIILLSIAIHKFIGVQGFVKSLDWFSQYFKLVKSLLTKEKLDAGGNGVLPVVVLLLPLFLVVGVIDAILGHSFYGLVGAVFDFVVLVMCIDASDWHGEVKGFTAAISSKNISDAEEVAAEFIEGELPKDLPSLTRAFTEAIFHRSQHTIFSVLFWFALFGAAGAAVYYAMYRFKLLTEKNQDYVAFSNAALLVLGTLDWLPVRLAGLSYALVGTFITAFTACLKRLVTGLKYSAALSSEFGLLALGLNTEDATSDEPAELEHALALVDRAVIVWIVVIALITIGGWL